MKYVLWFIGGAVLLGISLYFFITYLPTITTPVQPKIAATPTPEDLTAHETLVTYTQDGFSPQTVTIPINSSVMFRNLSSTTASVNSDDYPTNKLYPELNLGIFKKNQNLIVRITKAGIYTYHNQLNPKQTGKIIVQ